MKLAVATFLVLAMCCHSMRAFAEDLVPFSALMQTAGSQPSIPPLSSAQKDSTAVSTQPAQRLHMTSGGKIMVGVGIGVVGVGALVLAATGTLSDWGSSGHVAAGYGTGAAFVAGGTTLIVFGTRRREAR